MRSVSQGIVLVIAVLIGAALGLGWGASRSSFKLHRAGTGDARQLTNKVPQPLTNDIDRMVGDPNDSKWVTQVVEGMDWQPSIAVTVGGCDLSVSPATGSQAIY